MANISKSTLRSRKKYSFDATHAAELAEAGYIFDIEDTLKQFRVYAHGIAKDTFSKVVSSSTIKKPWAKALDRVEKKEEEVATKLVKAMGIKLTNNPRLQVINVFNEMMEYHFGTLDDNLNMEVLIYEWLRDVIARQINDEDLSDDIKEELKKITKRNNKILTKFRSDVKRASRILKDALTNSSDVVKMTELHENILKASTLGESLTPEEVIRLLNISKGYTQEGVSAYTASFLDQFSGVNILEIDLGLGTTKAKDKKTITEEVTSILSTSGWDTSPHKEAKLHFYTDFTIKVENKKNTDLKAAIGVSVKTTRTYTKNYVTHSVSREMDDSISFSDAQEKYGDVLGNLLKYAAVSFVSHYNIKGVKHHTDQILRPLAYILLNGIAFANSLSSGKTINQEGFHFLLNINNRYYWYSDLIASLIEGIEDYAGQAYKTTGVWKIEGVNDTFNIRQFLSMDIKRVSAKHYIKEYNLFKYEDRIAPMIQNTTLKRWYEEGQKMFNSASLRIDGKQFKVWKRLTVTAGRTRRKK